MLLKCEKRGVHRLGHGQREKHRLRSVTCTGEGGNVSRENQCRGELFGLILSSRERNVFEGLDSQSSNIFSVGGLCGNIGFGDLF